MRRTRSDVEGVDPASRLFSLPVLVRRDGSVVRLGAIVHLAGGSSHYCVKDIFVTYDLAKVKGYVYSPGHPGLEGGGVKLKIGG